MARPFTFARLLVVLLCLTMLPKPASARLMVWVGDLAVVTVDTGIVAVPNVHPDLLIFELDEGGGSVRRAGVGDRRV